MQPVRTDTPAQRMASSYVGVRRTAPQRPADATPAQPTWSYQSPSASSSATTTTVPGASSSTSSGRWRSPSAPEPLSSLPVSPFAAPGLDARPDPQVWLIATVTAAGGMRQLEGAGRSGAIPVGQPYGFLRA